MSHIKNLLFLLLLGCITFITIDQKQHIRIDSFQLQRYFTQKITDLEKLYFSFFPPKIVNFHLDINDNLNFKHHADSIKDNSTSINTLATINLKSQTKTCVSSILKIICPETKTFCATLSSPSYRKFLKLEAFLEFMFHERLDGIHCDYFETEDSLLPIKTINGKFTNLQN